MDNLNLITMLISCYINIENCGIYETQEKDVKGYLRQYFGATLDNEIEGKVKPNTNYLYVWLSSKAELDDIRHKFGEPSAVLKMGNNSYYAFMEIH